MTERSWSRVQELLHAALAQTPDQRSEFLSQACSDDEDIRREVESLLAYEGREHAILDEPPWDQIAAVARGTLFGDYRIIEMLGSGGMADVYRALDLKLGREVALKVLPPALTRGGDRIARLAHEAHILASLNHPNIGSIYGLAESDGTQALVLELVEGPTLAEHIAKRGRLSESEAIAISTQVIRGLEYAHERGVVHCDLKPANIKITPDGTVKVLDFGLARAATRILIAGPGASGHEPNTFAEEVWGTAAYASPEQAAGAELDQRSDIWSFGVLLYELLTGARPFEREALADTISAIASAEPDWEKAPLGSRRLLRSCLQKDRHVRLRNIGDALLLLELDEPSLRQSPVKRFQAGVGIAAVLFALVAAALAVALIRKQEAPRSPVRFLIYPPTNGTLGIFPPRISPDGRRIAFTAAGFDGHTLLWIRDLTSPEAYSLPGTDDAQSPFWSPDGRFLAFGSAGKLKKVSVSGGPVATLCDTGGRPVLGGDWSRQNVILFGGNSGSPIYRVSGSGGPATPVTKLDSTLFHAYPSFLPDGRRFIYVRVRIGTEGGAYIGSLDGEQDDVQAKPIISTNFNVAYLPSADSAGGRLLFLREGNLMVQPFNNSTLQLSGEAIPVASQILTYRTEALFSASSNGVLAYRAGGWNSRLAWFDREGKRLSDVPDADAQTGLAISPDGSRLAAGRRDRYTPRSAVWVYDLSSSAGMPLTFFGSTTSYAAEPVWSSDGSRIVFTSREYGASSLYSKLSSGVGKEEVLLQSDDAVHPEDCSMDGRFLMYSSINQETKSDLWILPLAGTAGERGRPEPYLRTEHNETDGRFSPDGRWIAYTSDESGRPEVYVQSFLKDSSSNGKWMISRNGGRQPRWRRDGREIFYLAQDDGIMAAEVNTDPYFRASEPRPLFHAPHLVGFDGPQYDVSNDGQRFLINTDPAVIASAPIVVTVNWREQ